MFQATRQDFHGMMLSGNWGASPILSNNICRNWSFSAVGGSTPPLAAEAASFNQTRNLFGGSDKTFMMLTYSVMVGGISATAPRNPQPKLVE